MITKIRDMMKRKNGQKGFTLIELIVVMAILAILAAIAIPRYSAVQDQAKIKADNATAKSIISAARIYDANNNTTGVATSELITSDNLMDIPAASQSGSKAAFSLDYSTPYYTVTWATDGSYGEDGTSTPPSD